jgi:hypothetical protein
MRDVYEDEYPHNLEDGVEQAAVTPDNKRR